ncbi:MAG: polyphosphate polymerase domain-containing protein [Clostridiales Family XIII bacterium]|nr:polyphosphate polymerase domain-containing protein [Clostridiales Family XIII bacterium]
MQMIFKRYEKKYRLNAAQYAALTARLAGRMTRDVHGAYTVFNLYYDTDRFDLIRASVEGPVYKEKFRLRCYESPRADTPVFPELKRKYEGFVYKRRIGLPYADLKDFSGASVPRAAGESQIAREIEYFLSFHRVSAKLFLAYDRIALRGREDSALRVTFDAGLRFRLTDLRLDSDAPGRAMLAPGTVLMEVKSPGSMPIWLCRILSDEGIFPVPFSKYGFCYKAYILQAGTGGGGEVYGGA